MIYINSDIQGGEATNALCFCGGAGQQDGSADFPGQASRNGEYSAAFFVYYFTGEHRNQDQIFLPKVLEYMGF